MSDMHRIAVIGAGMAGLTCARALRFEGHEVVVFDKARGPGGRLATRRGDHNFDHGAQFFTANDPAFAAEVEGWREAGVVDEWTPRLVTLHDGFAQRPSDRRRFVGTPRMSALMRHLTGELTVRYGTRIQQLRTEGGWRLVDTQGYEHSAFDAVVLAIPAPQAVELLESAAPQMARLIAEEVTMLPCWAVMATFEHALGVDFDAAWCEAPLDWIARDSSKPDREPGHTWVLHADPYWSIDHLEDDPAHVCEAMLTALSTLTEGLPRCTQVTAHRWRYARVATPLGASAIWNAETGLGLCGDWFIGPRVESAWRSGRALAQMM